MVRRIWFKCRSFADVKGRPTPMWLIGFVIGVAVFVSLYARSVWVNSVGFDWSLLFGCGGPLAVAGLFLPEADVDDEASTDADDEASPEEEDSYAHIERLERLRKIGVFDPDTLRELRRKEANQPFLVEGLIRRVSINLFVGDSGLGKTPFSVQTGLCVAAGVPLFGRQVRQGPVLYCDAESGAIEFSEMVDSISGFLNLRKAPTDFHVWSPNWDETATGKWAEELMERVSAIAPLLVIVDPLRTFWPEAEGKNSDAARMVTELREASRNYQTSWLILHHRRKANQQFGVVDLLESPQGWFQETAGSLAIVNQTDTRLGTVEGSGTTDLVVAGFRRGSGAIPPLHLARVMSSAGEPVGYRQLVGVEQLRPEDRDVFEQLKDKFRFTDVQKALGGTSASNALRFINLCLSLQIARKQADGKAYETIKGSQQ